MRESPCCAGTLIPLNKTHSPGDRRSPRHGPAAGGTARPPPLDTSLHTSVPNLGKDRSQGCWSGREPAVEGGAKQCWAGERGHSGAEDQEPAGPSPFRGRSRGHPGNRLFVNHLEQRGTLLERRHRREGRLEGTGRKRKGLFGLTCVTFPVFLLLRFFSSRGRGGNEGLGCFT